jgi:6-phospho-beta-glucosidase
MARNRIEKFMFEENAATASDMPLDHHTAKIAILGASNLYCVGLIKSLLHMSNKLRGCNIVLMDTDEENLELVYALGSRLFQYADVALTLERTTVREEALADADFVLTTFHTGGIQAQRLDEKIPLRHGLIGQEIIGAGGFFNALRTIPLVTSLAVEMEKVIPRAFLLNYTSPCNIVTEAIAHVSGIRTIGLCDGSMHEIADIAQAAGVGTTRGKRLYSRTVGLNQSNWTTAVWRDGIDVLPQIVAWCENFINTQPEMDASNYVQVMLRTLIAHYGAIPSQYMHYYYFPDAVLEFLQHKPTSHAEDLLALLPDLLAHYHEETQKVAPDPHKIPGNENFGTFALDILNSILNNTGEEWILNVPNNGSLNFLADDRVVELPCRVDARGAMPFTQGDGGIKIDQRGLISQLAEYEGATAQVALWGTRRDAIKALAANPLVSSYKKSEQVYDDLATAHKHYLPERLLH